MNELENLDELRAELSRKEDALVLAASYGKNLLEENEQVKRELQTALLECTLLEKVSYRFARAYHVIFAPRAHIALYKGVKRLAEDLDRDSVLYLWLYFNN